MSDGYILSIDQGTTGTRALLVDRAGAIRGSAYAEITQYYPRAGWVEHDPEELWTASVGAVNAALANAGAEPGEILGVGIANQRETTLLWDRATGKPVSRAIVWQDRRTSALCDELKQEGLEDSWRRKTGLVIDPYFSATKIRWLLDNVAGLRARAEDGQIAFGTIDSWLIWKLAAGALHITDCTNASRTLLYNIHDLEWDAEILSRLDIPRAVLPAIRSSSCVYAETDPAAFFGIRAPIAGIAGDQQAALFGQACHQEGMAKNTYGTGSFVVMHTGRAPVIGRERMLATIAWRVGDEPVEYALEGAIFATGAAIQWLRDGLGIIARADESEALAASVPDNADVYFVPALAGLGAPHWDPYARGAIVGLTRGVTKAHLARAALESIAYQTCDVVEAMTRESSIPLADLRADGGATGNAFLMQFQADLLGVPVEVPSIAETTAMGAAYFAGLAVGFWKSREELGARWHVARRFEPRMDADERRRLLERWRQAVGRAAGWASGGGGRGVS